MIEFIENYWTVLTCLFSAPFVIVCILLVFGALVAADAPWEVEKDCNE